MAVYGKLDEFNCENGDWTEYEDRLKQYFIANGLDGSTEADLKKKRAILLSSIGANTYSLIRKLCAPAKPGEKTYAELCTLLSEHKNPKPSVIVQRFRFNTRVRKPSESIATYVAELRKLCEHCDFTADQIEEMLRDRIVCGINHDQIQKRLLSESKLTYKSAIDIATAMETASRDIKDLQGQHQTDVHKVSAYKKHSKQPAAQQRSRQGASSMTPKPCFRCTGNHSPDLCRYKNTECWACKKVGHIDKACLGKQRARMRSDTSTRSSTTEVKPKQKNISYVAEDCEEDFSFDIYSVKDGSNRAFTVTPRIAGREITMEYDTGAAISLIPCHTYEEHFKNISLEKTDVRLRTYSGEKLTPLGKLQVPVTWNGQEHHLELMVVTSNGPALMGRDWISKMNVMSSDVNYVSSLTVDSLLETHENLFKEELGMLKSHQVSISVKSDVSPKFHKPRSLPFAMRTKVEEEISRLSKAGIIEPVQYSDWAAPVVPVRKPDGTLRLCGDYKVTVNQASRLEQYPIPLIDDIFAALSGGQTFTKLDMSHAYQQLVLDNDSRKYTTISTHKGLFQYTRLPFGVSSAPAIFQRTIENLLQGIPHVCVYLDDIIITGSTQEEHLQNLQEVFRRLSEAGLKLKRKKCLFMAKEVIYLGHKVSAEGLKPSPDKLRAIQEVQRPQNIAELQSFTGLINYYCKFIPTRSTLLEPLNKLMRAGEKFVWTQAQEQAFQETKKILLSSDVLTYYDPAKPLLLSCDASPYGVGAVLSHQMENGDEKPIGYVSRTLTKAEKGYSQLEKEGLALIFAVKRFHKYIYGRSFTLLTDHKPLTSILKDTKAIPSMASARIQRWSLILSMYEYTLQYRKGKENCNADALSRLPLTDSQESEEIPEVIHLLEVMDASPVTATKIREWTSKDPLLSRVHRYLLTGWPTHCMDASLQPYFRRRHELSTLDGCVLWGSRMVIPPPGRELLLKELHEGHPGMCRMKALGRAYVWWPKFDQDVEGRVNSCTSCQKEQNIPAPAPLHPWKYPDRPWSRIHIDYAGPYLGHMFLVVVDAHSKWLDVQQVSSANASQTITKLRSIFSTHGVPDTIISDNGTPFVNQQFEEFTQRNAIKHIRVAPYHPASNGLAERAVQVFKRSMAHYTTGTIETRLARFLLAYRRTPQSTTGKSPAELLMGRRLRTRLDHIFPDAADKVIKKQTGQKLQHDKKAKQRTLDLDDPVYVCTPGQNLMAGKIVTISGPTSFVVRLDDGRMIKRHIDHLRLRKDTSTAIPPDIIIPEPSVPTPVESSLPDQSSPEPTEPAGLVTDADAKLDVNSHSETPVLRRSSRTIKPPKRLEY